MLSVPYPKMLSFLFWQAEQKRTALVSKKVHVKISVRVTFVFTCTVVKRYRVYHRERILETSTLSCNEEEEEITKPPKR